MTVDVAAAEQTTAPLSGATGRRRRRGREWTVTLVLLALVFTLFVVTLMLGDSWLSPWDVIASLFYFSDSGGNDFIVRDLRLPIALSGLGVGLALGTAGIVFQKLLANPLASPDFVGISQGASLAGVICVVMFSAGAFVTAGFALAGALGAGALIYALAWRGGITGYRFILVGIGINQIAVALIGYVLAEADLFEAEEALRWIVGSIGQLGTTQINILLVTVALLVPFAALLGRPLAALELGDDTAKSLGVSVETSRALLLAIAIVLVAMATAAAGPVAFVAMVSGPIAQRIVKTGGSVLLPSALVGAVLVIGSELIAMYVLPVELPTGVVTGAIGSPYLIWLLISVNKEGRGG